MSDRLVWLTLYLLGCYHGLNPGMGWLFAVGLGFQDRSAAAVLRAIVPLALGHVISVALSCSPRFTLPLSYRIRLCTSQPPAF